LNALILAFWSFLWPTQPPLAPMYLEGSFRANLPRDDDKNWARPRNGEIAFDSGAGWLTGAVRSGVFELPSEINFATFGFLSHPGLKIYLQDEAKSRTLQLRQRVDPGTYWRRHFWKIPKDWQGTRARLIAEDNGTTEADFMGITAPHAGGESFRYSLFRAGVDVFTLLYLSILFLLPGLAAGLWAGRRWNLDFVGVITTSLCTSGVSSYLVFWAFFANVLLGKNLSLALCVGSFAFVLWRIKDPRELMRQIPGLKETVACLSLMLLAAVLYTSLGLLYVTDDPLADQAQVRYNPGFRPPDNVLPFILAERLYEGRSPKPPLLEIWTGSDRPPLQTGATLLLFTAARNLGSLYTLYQLGCIFLQCLAIAGVWALVRAAGLSNRFLVPILGLVIFSEVMSFHSFYVWPKLLAAAYMMLGMVPVFRGKWTMRDAILSSVCLSLGILAHTGVLFTLIPFALLALILRRLPDWKQLGAGLALTLVLLTPWRLYQTIYDPPGDHLLKFNLTDLHDNAQYRVPFGSLLRESYARLTPASYLDTKWKDVKTIFGGEEFTGLGTRDAGSLLIGLELGAFEHVFFSLGFLNLGFFCRLLIKTRSSAVKFADTCLILTAASMLFWIFVLYKPGATIIHQWSLAGMLILYVILAIYVLEGRPQLIKPLLALQLLAVFPLLIFAKPWTEKAPGLLFDAPLDPGMLMLALASAGGIVYFGWRAKLQEVS
jgi:hypothetical protein